MFYFVIPVYNMEQYLRDCLDSILAQTCRDYAVVLVNDGSKDSSESICREYCEGRPNFHLISNENHGPLHARVSGLQYVLDHATPADYVWFTDSDDWIEPDALAVLSEVLKDPDCDLVGMNYWINESRTAPENDHAAETVTGPGRIARDVLVGCGFSGVLWRYIYPVRVIPRFDYAPYQHLRFCDDVFQNCVMIGDCRKAVFIEDRLYHYREREASLSRTGLLPKMCQSFTVFEFIRDAMETRGVWTEEDSGVYLAKIRSWSKWCMETLAFGERTTAEKAEELRELSECAYFRETLGSGKPGLSARLVLGGRYGAAVRLEQVHKCVRNLKKKIRK